VLELRSAASSSSAFVYAFSADVDTTGIGQVFYRETTEAGLLQFTSSIIDDVFPDLAPVSLTSLFIATWFYVGYFDNNIDRVITTLMQSCALLTPVLVFETTTACCFADRLIFNQPFEFHACMYSHTTFIIAENSIPS
jgi:hypothetical protein